MEATVTLVVLLEGGRLKILSLQPRRVTRASNVSIDQQSEGFVTAGFARRTAMGLFVPLHQQIASKPIFE